MVSGRAEVSRNVKGLRFVRTTTSAQTTFRCLDADARSTPELWAMFNGGNLVTG
jgi:hypothetical protein